jgi:hypothetical protein
MVYFECFYEAEIRIFGGSAAAASACPQKKDMAV